MHRNNLDSPDSVIRFGSRSNKKKVNLGFRVLVVPYKKVVAQHSIWVFEQLCLGKII